MASGDPVHEGDQGELEEQASAQVHSDALTSGLASAPPTMSVDATLVPPHPEQAKATALKRVGTSNYHAMLVAKAATSQPSSSRLCRNLHMM